MQLESSVTLFDDEKVETRFAQLQITADGITSEVSRKVGNDEVISRINQSAEGIQIQANKVNVEGATIFSSGRLSQSNLNNAYDSKGSASTSVNNLKNDLSASSGTTVIHGGHITTGTLNANAVNANSGTFNTANIPNLNANKITAGTLSADRIASGSLSVGKIDASSGTFSTANIPNLSAAKITSDYLSADRIAANSIGASKIKVSEFVSIGDPSGRNIALGSQSVDIKNGSTVLSSFSASGASLGNNSDTASIGLCNNKGTIKGVYNSISSTNDNYVLTLKNNFSVATNGRYRELQIDNGGGNNEILMKAYHMPDGSYTYSTLLTAGSKTITVSNTGIGLDGNTNVEGQLTVDNNYIKNLYGYNNTVSYATNMYINSSGILHRTTNTSSRRYKHDIQSVKSKELDPRHLYDIEVMQFKYNKDVITNTEDCRYGKDLIGFISEQVKEHYPIAVDMNEDGECEAWNAQYMIPPMLALIQDLHKEVEQLKAERT